MRRLVIVPVAFLVGCASFSEDGGFGRVEQAVAERGAGQAQWVRSTEEADSVNTRIKELLAKPLSAGDDQIRRRASPALKKVRVGGPNIGKGQSFKSPVVELTKIAIHGHLQPVRPADNLGGLNRPLKVAGIDCVNLFRTEGGGNFPRLLPARVVEIYVRDALAASLEIPIGLPMSEKQNPHP